MGYKRMALALGAGYVLGAKAGEKRYEQLKETWENLRDSLQDSPFFQRLGESGKEAATRGLHAVRSRGEDRGDADADDQPLDHEHADDQPEDGGDPDEGYDDEEPDGG